MLGITEDGLNSCSHCSQRNRSLPVPLPSLTIAIRWSCFRRWKPFWLGSGGRCDPGRDAPFEEEMEAPSETYVAIPPSWVYPEWMLRQMPDRSRSQLLYWLLHSLRFIPGCVQLLHAVVWVWNKMIVQDANHLHWDLLNAVRLNHAARVDV